MINYKLDSDLISDNAKLMKKKIIDLMKENDDIILDLETIDYIDSIGLGMLVSLYKESLNRNISLKIKNPSDNVKKLFRITALDELFLD
ncbi:MAG TPA: STAS domain-containing protein [Clostridia bacterium]|nr:STAS domain-containing protein [Clostridia bacterium]